MCGWVRAWLPVCMCRPVQPRASQELARTLEARRRVAGLGRALLAGGPWPSPRLRHSLARAPPLRVAFLLPSLSCAADPGSHHHRPPRAPAAGGQRGGAGPRRLCARRAARPPAHAGPAGGRTAGWAGEGALVPACGWVLRLWPTQPSLDCMHRTRFCALHPAGQPAQVPGRSLPDPGAGERCSLPALRSCTCAAVRAALCCCCAAGRLRHVALPAGPLAARPAAGSPSRSLLVAGGTCQRGSAGQSGSK